MTGIFHSSPILNMKNFPLIIAIPKASWNKIRSPSSHNFLIMQSIFQKKIGDRLPSKLDLSF